MSVSLRPLIIVCAILSIVFCFIVLTSLVLDPSVQGKSLNARIISRLLFSNMMVGVIGLLYGILESSTYISIDYLCKAYVPILIFFFMNSCAFSFLLAYRFTIKTSAFSQKEMLMKLPAPLWVWWCVSLVLALPSAIANMVMKNGVSLVSDTEFSNRQCMFDYENTPAIVISCITLVAPIITYLVLTMRYYRLGIKALRASPQSVMARQTKRVGGYVLVWLIIWVPNVAFTIAKIIRPSIGHDDLLLVSIILSTSQGFWNVIVYVASNRTTRGRMLGLVGLDTSQSQVKGVLKEKKSPILLDEDLLLEMKNRESYVHSSQTSELNSSGRPTEFDARGSWMVIGGLNSPTPSTLRDSLLLPHNASDSEALNGFEIRDSIAIINQKQPDNRPTDNDSDNFVSKITNITASLRYDSDDDSDYEPTIEKTNVDGPVLKSGASNPMVIPNPAGRGQTSVDSNDSEKFIRFGLNTTRVLSGSLDSTSSQTWDRTGSHESIMLFRAGYLNVKLQSTGIFGGSGYTRKFFVLVNNVLWYFENKLAYEKDPNKPQNETAIDLSLYSLKVRSTRGVFTFELVTKYMDGRDSIGNRLDSWSMRQWQFSCDTVEELKDWTKVIDIATKVTSSAPVNPIL